MSVGLEVTMTELHRKPRAMVKDPQHCIRVVQSLQTFNSLQSFTDLCFVCARGFKVYAHKLLLCSVSAHLKEMLLQVPDGLGKITVHVPDIESRILQLLINLLYEGSARVSHIDFEEFKAIMVLLGIVLTSGSERVENLVRNEDPPSLLPAPSPAAPQMVYLPPDSSGVQYVLAPSSMVQGSLMSSGVQPSSPSSASSVAQPLMIPASTAQVQSGSQIMQILNSPGGQMAPFSGQIMQTVNSQMMQQTGQMMQQPINSQIMSPVNNQMMQPISSQMAQPVNNQMIHTSSPMLQPINNHPRFVQSAGHMVHQTGTPMLQTITSPLMQSPRQMIQPVNTLMMQQSPTQMVNGAQVVVQNNKQTVINNNHTQVNVHGKMGASSSDVSKAQASPQKLSPQEQPQKREFVRKRTNPKPIRPKPAPTQTPPPSELPPEKKSDPDTEDILSILQDFGDIQSLTGKDIHDKLKEKLNIDIPNSEIETMIKLCLSQEEDTEVSTETTPDSQKKGPRRKRRVLRSDDEDDEDFVPYAANKQVRRKRLI